MEHFPIDLCHAYGSHSMPASYNLFYLRAAFETLFLQAWESRLLNFSAVIWRSACITGAVSDKMRDLVFQSLLSCTPASDESIQSSEAVDPSNLSKNAKFTKFAGRFVVGVDGPRGAKIYQAIKILNLEPRKRTFKWAQILLESSLRVSRKFVLKQDLSQLLRRALTMDRNWAAEGLNKEDSRKMLPDAIVVEVNVTRCQKEPPLRLRKVTVRGRDPNYGNFYEENQD